MNKEIHRHMVMAEGLSPRAGSVLAGSEGYNPLSPATGSSDRDVCSTLSPCNAPPTSHAVFVLEVTQWNICSLQMERKINKLGAFNYLRESGLPQVSVIETQL